MSYTPVFAIHDEDLLHHACDAVKCVRFVLKDYAESERAKVVLTGPRDGLGVASRKARMHTKADIKRLVRQRLYSLAFSGRALGSSQRMGT